MGNIALELASVVVIIVPSIHLFDQLLNLNVDHLIFFSDSKSVLLFVRTWGAHKNDSLGASWCVRIFQLENAVDFFNYTHLRLIALELSHHALANVLDTLQLSISLTKIRLIESILQVVLEDSIASDSLAKLGILNTTETWLSLLDAEISQNSLVSLCIILV